MGVAYSLSMKIEKTRWSDQQYKVVAFFLKLAYFQKVIIVKNVPYIQVPNIPLVIS